MKNLVIITLTLVFAACNKSEPQQTRTVYTPVCDAGNAHVFESFAVGDTVYHEFILRNPNREAIRLVKCGSTCGCTTPECRPRTIGPGERFTLPVKVVMEHAGPFERSVVLETTADTPYVVLRLSGEARAIAH
jgi:hypothetical protein